MTVDIISIYDCINNEIDEKLVFVLAPFKEERTRIFNEVIKPVVEQKELNCLRADDIETNTNKINEIVRNIWSSRFIIADITGLNPNVMYEIGFAHAMDKEVIMIYEEENPINETRFPFDIGYIDILKYKNNPRGGIELQNRLKARIDFVISRITKSFKFELKKIIQNRQNMDVELSLVSQLEIRKKRIDYFTVHVIKNLIHFKNEHEILLNMITHYGRNTKEDNEKDYKKIVYKAKSLAEHNNNYLISFTKHLLENTSNFISNAWMVNKFPDYFHVFQIGLNVVANIPLSSIKDFRYIDNAKHNIERNIADLNFCIEALNDERKLVSLEIIESI